MPLAGSPIIFNGAASDKISTALLSLFHKPPTFFLQTAFSGIEDDQLTALLEFGIAQHEVLAHVVVVDVFGRRFIGVDPVRGRASR